MFNVLKESNISLHVVATGGGAGIQNILWETPGSSSYLSGATFPYATQEQEELLGFMPEHFCSQENAIDLASAAYMKAYRFGDKPPVGLGLTASVASTTLHKGEHRYHICIITDDKVVATSAVLKKGVGSFQRKYDGLLCDHEAIYALMTALNLDQLSALIDVSAQAQAQFLRRPFIKADGKRLSGIPLNYNFGLMPGAFNPPHVGHLEMGESFTNMCGKPVVHEVSAVTPHKPALSVQELLKRAKLLQGKDRYFSSDLSLFIDKSRAFLNTPIIIGADAMLRLFDPKWGTDIEKTLQEFVNNKTTFYVADRKIDGELMSASIILSQVSYNLYKTYGHMFFELSGQWDISSTELRNKIVK